MARYFFHTEDGIRDQDREGVELPDEGAARKAAVRYAGDLMSDDPGIVWDGGDFQVEVTDANGLILFVVITFAVRTKA